MKDKIFILTVVLTSLCSCKKLVEVETPLTSLNRENVYSTDQSAIMVLTAIYGDMSNGNSKFSTGVNSISLKCGLSADELTGTVSSLGGSLAQFYMNNLSSQNGLTFWESFYYYLFQVNSALTGVSNSTALKPEVKKQLMGECFFMRAFINFYLVNLYGDVPLVLSTDYNVNSNISKSSKAKVYEQIISDLKESQTLLSDVFVDGHLKPSGERVRPTMWAATALLARVYLFNGQAADAESQASKLITSPLFSLESVGNVFLKNSMEAIWQIQPVNVGWNTEDARTFVLTGAPNFRRPTFLNIFLLSAFDANDQRLANWVDSVQSGTKTYYYSFKYKEYLQNTAVTSPSAMTEYLMVFRLGEQYLIRAEARGLQNKLSEALDDLNAIRTRAGLSDTLINNQPALLDAILRERQVELFTEWGHRWLDLKRTGRV